MVEKRYVAKKRIPEYCPFGSVMSLKVESENDAPACFGRVVGYQYEGSDEVVSTIEGDNLKAKGERIIDRLMYDGYLVKHQTVKKIDNLGTVNVTQYGIMYEAESAAQHKGTPTHGIPSPTAGQFICTFELLMVTEINGELYERYITIRKKTPPVFRFTTTDFFCNMGSYITTMLCRGESGFKMLDTDDNPNRCSAQFYDTFGVKKNIIFNSTKDLLATIVSVRLVDVKPFEVAESSIAG